MKIIFLLCLYQFLFFRSDCQGTDKVPRLPLNGSNIAYAATLEAGPSVSKERLFSNAQEWYRKHFQSADNTLTINNVDEGLLSGTGIIHAKGHEKQVSPGDLFFTVNIAVKTGKWHYVVDSIYSFEKGEKFYYSDMYSEEMYPPAKPKWQKPYREAMLIYMNAKISEVIEQMREEIGK